MKRDEVISRALVVAMLLGGGELASGQFIARDLGYGYAYSINSSGTIAGVAGVDWPRRAFSQSGSTMTDLGTLGGTWSIAYSLNDWGVVVGASATASGSQHACAHSSGMMTDLDASSSTSSSAYAINNVGTIIGVRGSHAFSYGDGVFTDLGTLGGNSSAAYGINALGTIVGGSDTIGGPEHAFTYSGGIMTDLGTFGGIASRARDINDLGVITGTLTTASGDDNAFIYSDGVVHPLGTLGGPWTWPSDLNNEGTVVGNNYLDSTRCHAFVYRDGAMVDLAPVLADIGITGFSQALGINERGDIVGWGEDAAGSPHAFLLAVPEPSALTLLGAGTVGLAAMRLSRRKPRRTNLAAIPRTNTSPTPPRRRRLHSPGGGISPLRPARRVCRTR